MSQNLLRVPDLSHRLELQSSEHLGADDEIVIDSNLLPLILDHHGEVFKLNGSLVACCLDRFNPLQTQACTLLT